jgi:phenylacetate-CoA ligase
MRARELIARGLLSLSGRRVFQHLSEIRRLAQESDAAGLKRFQRSKLESLLWHAHKTVPHYNTVLSSHGVIDGDRINIDRFSSLPPLTKNQIRNSGKDLHSSCPEARTYVNTSGGSTGEPVEFMQSANYDDWNTANKLYFNMLHGKYFGEPEIKLWGSDRDILEGTLGFRQNVINYLYNRRFLNTFDLSNETFADFVNVINSFRPVSIWGYYDSTYELAKYINNQKLNVHSPRVVITTIGKLLEPMREEIRRAFGCPVIDQYGSREVGAVAVEKAERKPLSLFPWSHMVEVVDEHNQPMLGQEGRILVTVLNNYSMPLIRYEIGDLAIMAKDNKEFPFDFLAEVTGRQFAHFVRRDGSLVHAQFFVILTFGKAWIRRFQFIQHEFDDIELIVESDENPPPEDVVAMRQRIQHVMGPACKFSVRSGSVAPSASGKYLYTICQIR